MQSLCRRLLARALPVSAATALVFSSSIAAAASSASHPRKAESSLTGTWSGKYSGAYHGTFTLHWKQKESRLTGRIQLSATAAPVSVRGTVHDSTIRFGTVGTSAITYSGRVSGKSMSGSYQTPGGGGSWSAHKTS
jgi:hypothetical protein